MSAAWRKYWGSNHPHKLVVGPEYTKDLFFAKRSFLECSGFQDARLIDNYIDYYVRGTNKKPAPVERLTLNESDLVIRLLVVEFDSEAKLNLFFEPQSKLCFLKTEEATQKEFLQVTV